MHRLFFIHLVLPFVMIWLSLKEKLSEETSNGQNFYIYHMNLGELGKAHVLNITMLAAAPQDKGTSIFRGLKGHCGNVPSTPFKPLPKPHALSRQ